MNISAFYLPPLAARDLVRVSHHHARPEPVSRAASSASVIDDAILPISSADRRSNSMRKALPETQW
jgi:hypothetical protein